MVKLSVKSNFEHGSKKDESAKNVKKEFKAGYVLTKEDVEHIGEKALASLLSSGTVGEQKDEPAKETSKDSKKKE